MKKILVSIFLIFAGHQNLTSVEIENDKSHADNEIVTSTFKIELDEFPLSYNPSIHEFGDDYILTFRYLPEPVKEPWISYIGLLLLDRSFERISDPVLLDARSPDSLIPPQAEDVRIFSYQGKLYLIYNDNPELKNPSARQRRDMYVAQLFYTNNIFTLAPPIKLVHPEKYAKHLWQKNWSPFVCDDTLYLSYSQTPHEVLMVDFESGICAPIYSTPTPTSWAWGTLRGGTPSLLVDGEYLGFFHSAKRMVSKVSNGMNMWHYFMGAYTFSANPPFNMTKMSTKPINKKSFYMKSDEPKRVIYPGGFVISKGTIYLAYGKDDHEVWIAVIDKDALINSLTPL